MRGIGKEGALRLLSPAAVLALTALLAGLYLGGFEHAYQAILNGFGFEPFRYPFLDSKVALAAAECHAAGLDVYLTNPCDPLGRVQFYSPIIPHLSGVGLHRLDLNALGLGLIGLYALVAWMIMRPTSLGATAVALAAVLSYACVFGLERGQLEVLILFCAAMLGVLHTRGLAGRIGGYGLALAAGLLKLFPMALFALLVREKLWRALVIGGLALLCFGAVVFVFREDYQRLTSNIERCGYFCDQYWVGNLALRFTEADRQSPLGMGVRAAITLLFAALAAAVAHRLHRSGFRPVAGDRNTALLAISALLVVSSYLAESNTDYRAMHLLLAIPFLLDSVKGRERFWSVALLAGLLVVLWMGPLIRLGLPLATLVLPNSDYWAAQLVYGGRDLVWFAAMIGLAGLGGAILRSMARPTLEALFSGRASGPPRRP